MTDREKLINLILKISDGKLIYGKEETINITENLGELIDRLLSGGVTVKEPQKPLTLAEARERNKKRSPLYVECNFTGMWHGILPFDGWVVSFSWLRSWLEPYDNPSGFLEENYGVYWRCWAEKPTEEEREAAEWEK